METQDFIALALLLPLLGTLMIWMSGARPNQREVVTVVTAVLTFLCVLQVLPPVLAGETPSLLIGNVIPGL